MKTFAQFLLEKVSRFELKGANWNAPINWATIAQHIHDNTCNAARKNQDCGHPTCEEGKELSHIASGAFEDSPPFQNYIEKMINFIHRKRCSVSKSGKTCGHPGCEKHEHYMDWLQERI